MSVGRGYQFESDLEYVIKGKKPWGMLRNSHRFEKAKKNRRERRRARLNPECIPEYNKYYGYEY